MEIENFKLGLNNRNEEFTSCQIELKESQGKLDAIQFELVKEQLKTEN